MAALPAQRAARPLTAAGRLPAARQVKAQAQGHGAQHKAKCLRHGGGEGMLYVSELGEKRVRAGTATPRCLEQQKRHQAGGATGLQGTVGVEPPAPGVLEGAGQQDAQGDEHAPADGRQPGMGLQVAGRGRQRKDTRVSACQTPCHAQLNAARQHAAAGRPAHRLEGGVVFINLPFDCVPADGGAAGLGLGGSQHREAGR